MYCTQDSSDSQDRTYHTVTVLFIRWYYVYNQFPNTSICDPFCQNEMLLCKTSNGDMAENTCGGHFFYFEILAKS